MATMIGSARIDENGHISGGKPGDQTSKEVSTQAWYQHSKGWRVLRANRLEVAQKLCEAMLNACNNQKIGYNQTRRNTLYKQVEPYGFNPSKATVATETDCSALVRVCCAYAGIHTKDFVTSNLATVLLATGEFTELKESKYTGSGTMLRKGDILVTKTKGHTVIVVSDGSNVSKDTWKYKAEEKPAPVEPEKPKEEKVGKGVVTVASGAWNIRSYPSTNGGKIGIVKKGATLHCTEVKNGWCHVWGNLDNGKRFEDGWISEKGVKK